MFGATRGRVCGDSAPSMPGESTYRCTLRNQHMGYHLARSEEKVLDTWPRPEDVDLATAEAISNGWRIA